MLSALTAVFHGQPLPLRAQTLVWDPCLVGLAVQNGESGSYISSKEHPLRSSRSRGVRELRSAPLGDY